MIKEKSEHYGYIYLTINLVNGKKYIGLHSTDLVVDKYYLGSGKDFITDLKRYGRKNFTQKILYYADSRKELEFAEKLFIRSRNAVSSKMYYNIHPGGSGGNMRIYMDKDKIEETDKKISESMKERWKDEEYRKKVVERTIEELNKPETRKKISEGVKNKRKNDKNYVKRQRENTITAMQTETYKKNLSKGISNKGNGRATFFVLYRNNEIVFKCWNKSPFADFLFDSNIVNYKYGTILGYLKQKEWVINSEYKVKKFRRQDFRKNIDLVNELLDENQIFGF